MTALTDDMKRVVREQKLGFVATVCPDGTPNVSPKGTVTVWDDDHLVFLDLRSPRTIENLTRNHAIEINVVDPIRRKGYRFKGEGTVISDGEVFERVLDLFQQERGIPRGRARAAVLTTIERAAPLLSPVYDSGVSEEEVAANWLAHHWALGQAGGAENDAGDFVARFAEAWRDPDPAVFRGFWHEDGWLLHPTMEHPIAAESVPQHVEGLMRALPDVSLRVLRWASRDDHLFIEWELTGTLGDERLVVPGVDRFTLRGGRAVEGVAYFDTGAWSRNPPSGADG
jgi:predicted pyridoxine 5'-phosphate oxidase superfamily flavin-nucleotide-binding protein